MTSRREASESDAKAGARSGREQRLAEALRANLKRRKARERQRSSVAADDGEGNEKEPG
jgi:hypothetical protein